MKKPLIPIVAIALTVIAAYWYFSPYLTMYAMRTAIQARDAHAFNAHVDYPSVRETLKSELAGRAAAKMDERGSPASGAEALGRALGLALIAPMVDALVRPEVMMRAIDEGAIDIRGRPGHERSGDAPDVRTDRVGRRWTVEREGLDRVIVSRRDQDQDGSSAVAAVLERRGFADWRLTRIRLSGR